MISVVESQPTGEDFDLVRTVETIFSADRQPVAFAEFRISPPAAADGGGGGQGA